MSDAIRYCDRCGRLISPADISRGVGHVTRKLSICATCVDTLTPEQRAALRGTPEPRELKPITEKRMAPGVRRRTTSTRRNTPRPQASEASSSSGLIIGGGVGFGVAVGVVVALLLSGGDEQGAESGPVDAGAASVPVVPAAPDGGKADPGHTAVVESKPEQETGPREPKPAGPDAAALMAKAKALVDEQLTLYDEARAALMAVAERFPGTPEASEAVRLVAEIDASHMKIADAALAEAEKTAEELYAKGKKHEAASVLRAVEARYRGTEWYRSKGAQDIKLALSLLGERAGTAAKTVVAGPIAGGGSIDYSRGFAGSSLALNQDAKLEGSRLRLNRDVNGMRGSAFHPTKVDVRAFACSFQFQLPDASDNPGDGFSFIVQGDRPTVTGGSGDGLGYVGIMKSVAIGFRHFTDCELRLGINGRWQANPRKLPPGIAMNDGSTYAVDMEYDGTELTVSIRDTGTGERVLERFRLDIPTEVGGPAAYVGFAAGTGGARIAHDILSWAFGLGREEALFDVDFASDTVDGSPAVAAAAAQTAKRPTDVKTTNDQTALIRASAGGLTDRPVELVSTSNEDRVPRLLFEFDEPITGGRVNVSWRSAVTKYTVRTKGAPENKVETGLSFRFMNEKTDPFIGVQYINSKVDGSGGDVRTDWVEGTREYAVELADRVYKTGGDPDAFLVELDLDEGRATVHLNDKVIARDVPFVARSWQGGFRGLEITDGQACGGLDGAFTAVVDDIKIWRPGVSTTVAEPALAATHVPGLRGTYFKGKAPGKLTKILERVDEQMSFGWGLEGPDAGSDLGEDDFTIRWVGEIDIPMGAQYTFYCDFDDAATVSIGGKDLGLPSNGKKTVRLPGGWQPIVIEYAEGGGSAAMHLSLSGGGLDRTVLGGALLRTSARGSAVAGGAGDEVLASVVYNPEKKSSAMSLWGHAETIVDGVSCIHTSKTDGKGDGAKFYVHVNMSDDLRFKLTDEKGVPRRKVQLRVRYLDEGDQPWDVQYGDGKTIRINKGDTGEWQTELIDLPDATFPSKKFGGNDFRLCSLGWAGGDDLYLSSVELVVDKPVGGEPGDAVAMPTGPAEPLPGETGKPGQWAPGLVGEYFKGKGFTERVAVRIDRRLALNFGWTYTDPAAGKDSFTIRWTGWLYIPRDGVYEFHTDANDWMNVDIDGKRIVGGGGGKQSGVKKLAAGLHPIKVVYYEGGSEGRYYLKWVTPGSTKPQNMDSALLFHRVPELGSMGPPAKIVAGLWAEYFVGANFERKVAEGPLYSTKIESGAFPFCSSLPADRFSVRISGTVIEGSSADREYGLRADGGVRVTLDDEILFDHWSGVNGYQKEKRKYTSGHHKLLIEYRNIKGPAKLHLQWHASGRFVDIYASHLYHEARPAEVVDRAGLAPGIRETYYRGSRPGGRAAGARIGVDGVFWAGTNPPVPGVPGGTHAGIAKGVLLVPRKGVYLFRMHRSGGLQVSVGGKRLVSKWDKKTGWELAQAVLRPGPQSLVVAFAAHGKQEFSLEWAGPDFCFRGIGPGDVAIKAKELSIAPPWEDVEQKVVDQGAGRGPATDVDTKPDAPPEPMPEGNLVVNGGFETTNPETKFADRWTSHQWGAAGVNFSARLDRGNPHAGERSLAVRATSDGALPGAFTTLSVALPAGKYEVSFWACADVDATARMHAKLGDREIEGVTVKEDFTRVSGIVEVTERMSRATLRIWTSTCRVRVWFDDVEVRAVK